MSYKILEIYDGVGLVTRLPERISFTGGITVSATANDVTVNVPANAAMQSEIDLIESTVGLSATGALDITPFIGTNYLTTATKITDMLVILDSNLRLSSLSDTAITTPTTNQLLMYNGANWVNTTVPALSPTSQVIAQSVYAAIPGLQGTASIPVGTTIPTIAQGAPLANANITPTSATSTIKVTVSCMFSAATYTIQGVFSVFRDNVCIGTALDAAAYNLLGQVITFVVYDTPNTTATTNYSVRVGRSATPTGTWYVNRLSGITTPMGGTLHDTFLIEEILV